MSRSAILLAVIHKQAYNDNLPLQAYRSRRRILYSKGMASCHASLTKILLLLVHCAVVVLIVVPASCSGQQLGKQLASLRDPIAKGPLRRNPANPYYFTDGSGKAIYLTGSHTWSNLMDRGQTNPIAVAFDYVNYLKWMVDHNYNFMRLWTAELPNVSGSSDDPEGRHVAVPWKWLRTGPGSADDGGLKFDLSKLDQRYFDRMRYRVTLAGRNGIYVSIMFFNGFEWQSDTNAHDGDPFAVTNNINGVNCPGICPTSTSEITDEVWEIESAYLRKVVDTVNDLDNVLYEVTNESGSPYSDAWQARVIEYVKHYEETKPKHHPIGMTYQYQGGSDLTLYNSNADWFSSGSHVPRTDGRKVIINDTDHAFSYHEFKDQGPTSQRTWVWENFTSGNNVIFMDPYLTKWPERNYPGGSTADIGMGNKPDPYWNGIRDAMGATLTYANRMNLVAMKPEAELSSTEFCLAARGSEYLVYNPSARPFSVQLDHGTYQYEWFNPSTNIVVDSGTITVAAGKQMFTPPFSGDSVLYLHKSARET